MRFFSELKTNEIARLGRQRLVDRAARVVGHRLGKRRLRPGPTLAHLRAREPFGAHAFHEVLELVALGAREVRDGRDDHRLDDLRRQIAAVDAALELLGDLLKEGDAAAVVLDEQIGEVDVLHVETNVGLVVTVVSHRLGVGHLGELARRVELAQIDAESFFPDRKHEPFDEAKDVVLVDERHLDVDLRELGLAVEAKILVAEALHDLEVAIESRDHEELFEELGALGQGVEFPGREARGDDEVARAAGRGAHHVRRFELEAARL